MFVADRRHKIGLGCLREPVEEVPDLRDSPLQDLPLPIGDDATRLEEQVPEQILGRLLGRFSLAVQFGQVAVTNADGEHPRAFREFAADGDERVALCFDAALGYASHPWSLHRGGTWGVPTFPVCVEPWFSPLIVKWTTKSLSRMVQKGCVLGNILGPSAWGPFWPISLIHKEFRRRLAAPRVLPCHERHSLSRETLVCKSGAFRHFVSGKSPLVLRG